MQEPYSNLSYWEYKSWLSDIDFTIVGSGITGLSCALQLRKRFPKAKILILERGSLPQGASTKNAGFACFGSVSELLSDLEWHSEDEVLKLVKMRVEGLKVLRETFGDRAIDFQKCGGYELFLNTNLELFENCLSQIEYLNELLEPVFKKPIFSSVQNRFQFKNVQENLLFNAEEGTIDTGNMMQGLLQKALQQNILILNNWTVTGFETLSNSVEVRANSISFKTSKLFIATNGFAAHLGIAQVQPARNQVLVTKPIPDLKIKGMFHLDEGYTYFRNIDNRILLGGGRNLDLTGEQTDALGTSAIIQAHLEQTLAEVILPQTPVEIDYRWSGILGVGAQKKPILKPLSENVFCGVRLGGMGVAIGSQIGKELADLLASP